MEVFGMYVISDCYLLSSKSPVFAPYALHNLLTTQKRNNNTEIKKPYLLM